MNQTNPDELSLSEIVQLMKNYVDQNEQKIDFSDAFKSAFQSILKIDEQLQDEQFDSFLKKHNLTEPEMTDSINVYRRNMFNLQLRIIVRKKLIIENELQKLPNIKALIDLFNQKLEALLKIEDAQREMEEQKKFVQIVNVEKQPDTQSVRIIEDAWKQYTDILDQILHFREGIKISMNRLTDRQTVLSQLQTTTESEKTAFAQKSVDVAMSEFENTLTTLNTTLQQIKQIPITQPTEILVPTVFESYFKLLEENTQQLISGYDESIYKQRIDIINDIIKNFPVTVASIIEEKKKNRYAEYMYNLFDLLKDVPYTDQTINSFFEIKFPLKETPNDIDDRILENETYIQNIILVVTKIQEQDKLLQDSFPQLNATNLQFFLQMAQTHFASFNTYCEQKIQAYDPQLKTITNQKQLFVSQLQALSKLSQTREQIPNITNDNSDTEYNMYLIRQKLEDFDLTENLVQSEILQIQQKITNTQQNINVLFPVNNAVHFGTNNKNESVFNNIRRFFENDDVQKVHVIAMTETHNTRVKEIMTSFFIPVNSLLNENIHKLYTIVQHDTELMHSFQENKTTFTYLHLYHFTDAFISQMKKVCSSVCIIS